MLNLHYYQNPSAGKKTEQKINHFIHMTPDTPNQVNLTSSTLYMFYFTYQTKNINQNKY